MKTAQPGIDLIIFFESLHDGDLHQIGLQPKMCPAGIWTEGYGRAMRDDNGNFIKGIKNKALAYSRISIRTKAEAMKALAQDITVFELIVNRKIRVPITQQQFDALVSHTYNTGGSNTIFSMINNKSNAAALKLWWLNHYITGQGNPKPLAGLIARRQAEVKLLFS